MRIAYTALFLALLGTAAFAADVYRSVAPDGTVSYSDRPQGNDSQFIFSVASRSQRATATPGAQAPGSAGGAAGGSEAAGAPTPAGPPSAVVRAERQRNCELAREREQLYTVSRRLFRNNASGEREYLDDAAAAAARTQAAADVKDWCG